MVRKRRRGSSSTVRCDANRRRARWAARIVGHYRPVARICGKTIYLHKDVERSQPKAHARSDATRASECESVTVLPHLLRELS